MLNQKGEKDKSGGSGCLDNLVQIIVALISATAVVIAAIIAALWARPGTSSVTTPIIVLPTSVSTPVQAISTERVPAFTPATPSIKIAYPPSDAFVKIEEEVRGTQQNVPEGYVIWVMVYPHSVGRYYPQNNPADLEASGKWRSRAVIGVTDNVGQKFDIIVVLADKQAQDAFVAYLVEAKGRADYPGLTKLPGNALIYDSVTVTRQ